MNFGSGSWKEQHGLQHSLYLHLENWKFYSKCRDYQKDLYKSWHDKQTEYVSSVL